MKTEDISNKRQLLARKNYGRRQVVQFLNDLSLALSQKLKPQNLLPLEETDTMYQHYVECFKLAIDGKLPTYQQVWPSTVKDQVEVKLSCFRNNVANNEVILFPRGFNYSGALRVDLHIVLEHVFELMLIDKDSVSLLEERKTNGFMLDTHDDSELGDEVYELIVWGSDWISAISKC